MIASKNRGFLTADVMPSAFVVSPSTVLRFWLWMNKAALRISTQKKQRFVAFGVEFSSCKVDGC
jgi:hypothetical protein